MITVILAGGSGTRLWPLSTPDKPKHLLSLNGRQTLLQDAYHRAKLCSDEVYVVTDASHAELVREQLLDELDDEYIVVEPQRRGTASCIALALAVVKNRHGAGVTVGFVHADHHIVDKEKFAQTVKQAAGCSEAHKSIALIGIEPSYPATGFGYIKRGETLDGCWQVEAFFEKPDLAGAQSYLESGEYLWNLGLFVAPLTTFETEIERFSPELHRAMGELESAVSTGEEFDELYKELPTRAIEPAVMEKTDNVVVVPGEFDWMDIGSFKDLHESLPKSDAHGNAIEGEAVCIDTSESIVMEHTGRPVAVMGLENVVVVSTDKGLLVCHKEYSQAVKQVADTFSQEDR